MTELFGDRNTSIHCMKIWLAYGSSRKSKSNFEISLVVFMPNITAIHAFTYIYPIISFFRSNASIRFKSGINVWVFDGYDCKIDNVSKIWDTIFLDCRVIFHNPKFHFDPMLSKWARASVLQNRTLALRKFYIKICKRQHEIWLARKVILEVP